MGHEIAGEIVSLDDVSQENLEGRVNALETTVEEIRTEIRDFRNATTVSFNTLREDFGDLRTRVDRGFTEMRGTLDATAGGQQHIADLTQRLIDDQDR